MPTKQELEDELAALKAAHAALTQAQAQPDTMALITALAKSQQDMQASMQASVAGLIQAQKDMLQQIGQANAPAGPPNAGGAQNVGRNQVQAATVPKVNLSTPEALQSDFSVAKFQQWKAVWTDYANVVQLNKHDRENQLAVFRNCLSLEMRSVLTEVIGVPEHTAANPLTVEVLLTKIQDYFRS